MLFGLWLLQDCIGCMYVEKLEDHCRITVPYSALRYRGSGENTSEEIDNSNSLFVDYELGSRSRLPKREY
jgi:hypothetical protein